MKFLIILMFLFSSACQSLSDGPVYGTPRPGEGPTLQMLALGDSYTIGQGVTLTERWPHQLHQAWQGRFSTNISITYIARTGWTTGNLSYALQTTSLSPPYDLVSLLIGVNNQYQGRSISEYSQGFTALLAEAIEYSGYRTNLVFVVSIPDYAYTPFISPGLRSTVSSQINIFNATNSNITLMAGVKYFNITPISRQGLSQPELVATDNLHPSALQYQRWIEEVIFTGLTQP